MNKLILASLSSAMLFLGCINAHAWCEYGTETGEYQVGLTSGNPSGSSCFKSGVSGRVFSFTLSELSTSSDCPAYPCVYCDNNFMSELHTPGETITCSVGEMLRIGYDTSCTSSENNAQGIIKVTGSAGPSDYSWLAWLTGGVIGVAGVTASVVASVGAAAGVSLFSVFVYKYWQHTRSATIGDKSGALLGDYE